MDRQKIRDRNLTKYGAAQGRRKEDSWMEADAADPRAASG
jgi:hypothetical protein